jgi:AcrR family transcriptional regulator
MVFEAHIMKSAVQAAVEAILEQPAGRHDAAARRERAKAAMILECALHGYTQSKISAVAKQAKISTASIYRDFGDRDTLLLQSLELAMGVFARHWLHETSEQEPVKRIEALLLAHGKALADPFSGWIFRLFAHLANTTAPYLLVLGQAVRDANLAVWYSEIAALEAAGHLAATDHRLVAALLLGAVERPTIFSRMAFGENDVDRPNIKDVARYMSLALFQVFGTRAFWSRRQDKPAPGWVGDGPVHHGLSNAPPKPLFDQPSLRLKAYGERILARDVNRLDGEGRKVRIQLAAMMECVDFGYEAATMASVAARAGVSTATFYQDYPNKRALFLDAILLQSRFRADYESFIHHYSSPRDAFTALNFSIAKVLADPDFLWFHRISMASEISDAPELIASSRATRSYTEGFWCNYLTTLETNGHLNPHDKALTLNALLGPTQRRSVLSMVFFGADDVSEDELSRLALASTDFIWRLVGKTGH